MPWRMYTSRQKYTKHDGTVSTYLLKNKKWINNNKPYKPQKRGFEKKSIWSNRFGFLDLYNRREQQELKCPSGYSISQCFNVLRKMWVGYHCSNNQNDTWNMEHMQKVFNQFKKIWQSRLHNFLILQSTKTSLFSITDKASESYLKPSLR